MNTLEQDHGGSVEIEGDIVEPDFLTPVALSAHKTENSNDFSHQNLGGPADDLRSHTQQIFHFLEQKDNKSIYGALVDLFLVLGNKGLALRKRMLISARTLLTDGEFDSLKQSLSLGLKSESQSIPVQQSSNDKLEIFSAIDEAKNYMEYGQFEAAVNILQEAILLNPRRLALHHDLLEIFQKGAKKELFISFYEELLNIKIALPPLWKKVAQDFGYEAQ